MSVFSVLMMLCFWSGVCVCVLSADIVVFLVRCVCLCSQC